MADIESFRARTQAELPPIPVTGRQKARRPATEPFLRGPIPLAWLARAHRAGGSALAVGLSLWFVRGVSGKRGPVKVDSSTRRRLELSRDQTNYGLPALEAAGLIRYVKKGRGHCAVVEILDHPKRPAPHGGIALGGVGGQTA
jgi:hypothetical protein